LIDASVELPRLVTLGGASKLLIASYVSTGLTMRYGDSHGDECAVPHTIADNGLRVETLAAQPYESSRKFLGMPIHTSLVIRQHGPIRTGPRCGQSGSYDDALASLVPIRAALGA
jgi:hypothetical protein